MNYHDLRALSVKRFNIPKERPIREAVKNFTLAEKAVYYFFAALFILSTTVLLWRVNNLFLTEVPLKGGTLTEGVVGNPRFINPVLAISEADKNLAALVYSGLVRITPSGEVVDDLADSITTASSSLVYTAHIRLGAVFHDDTPVTADDIIFTIQKIEDPSLNSPHFADWSGVTVAKVDDSTVTFTLKKPYAPFINNLALGILPKHIWNTVTNDEFFFSQFNALPVGSGPYTIGNVERDSGGIPNYYELTAFDRPQSGSPYLQHIDFRFYANENDLLDAYNSGNIGSLAGISPDEALALRKGGATVLSSPLPRIFGVFFNQNENKVFLQKEVRTALDLAAPKEGIVNTILDGYGTPIDGPLPPALFPWVTAIATTTNYVSRIKQAEDLLAKNGWTKNANGVLEKKTKSDTLTLSFSISTSDTPELKATADMLKRAWEQIGAHVDLQVFDPGDLNQNVIRPRHYDALLFGEVVGRDADVYPFWHSSERNDPGLNIALYANSKVDKYLEDARSTSDTAKREADYKGFNTEVQNDVPAVFLYTPSFLYVVPDNVQAIDLGELSLAEDRFEGIRSWYIDTDRVWNLFVK